MKRNRHDYIGRKPYRKKKGAARKKMFLKWAIVVIMTLAASGMIFLMVCGCLYLRDRVEEKRMEDAYAKQPWAGHPIEKDPVGQGQGPDAVEANGNNVVGRPDGAGEMHESPLPSAKPTSQPSKSPAPGAPTAEPDSNGHELDDEMVIVIDAGHGGYDGGSSSGKVIEKDVNLAVANEIARLLKEHGGITVVQTRASDEHLSLQERSDIGNEAKCDYFVSVHCNTYKQDSSVHGLECYYYEKSEEGKKFAQGVIDDLKQYKDMKIRSAKADTLAVTRHTYCPAILIEMGFLTNPTDKANLADADYQKKLAKRITDAVLKTIGL